MVIFPHLLRDPLTPACCNVLASFVRKYCCSTQFGCTRAQATDISFRCANVWKLIPCQRALVGTQRYAEFGDSRGRFIRFCEGEINMNEGSMVAVTATIRKKKKNTVAAAISSCRKSTNGSGKNNITAPLRSIAPRWALPWSTSRGECRTARCSW